MPPPAPPPKLAARRPRHPQRVAAGAFKTKAEASLRRQWVAGELAALRAPDFAFSTNERPMSPTVKQAAERWLASRVDVAANTKANHRAAVASIVPIIGNREITTVTADDVAELVTKLFETRKRQTVRKTLLGLAMVFDHARITRVHRALLMPFCRGLKAGCRHICIPTYSARPLGLARAAGQQHRRVGRPASASKSSVNHLASTASAKSPAVPEGKLADALEVPPPRPLALPAATRLWARSGHDGWSAIGLPHRHTSDQEL